MKDCVEVARNFLNGKNTKNMNLASDELEQRLAKARSLGLDVGFSKIYIEAVEQTKAFI